MSLRKLIINKITTYCLTRIQRRMCVQVVFTFDFIESFVRVIPMPSTDDQVPVVIK